MSKCKCSWSISILGDGCRYCQPQEYIDHLEESLKELEENDDKLERVLMFVGMAAKYLEAAEYTKVKNKLRHIAQAIV